MKYYMSGVVNMWVEVEVDAPQNATEEELEDLFVQAVNDDEFYVKDTDFTDITVDGYDEEDEDDEDYEY